MPMPEPDTLAERRATGIIHALTDRDEATCSDCGESIDVSADTDPMAVVTTLKAHRQDCSGEWFDG